VSVLSGAVRVFEGALMTAVAPARSRLRFHGLTVTSWNLPPVTEVLSW